VGYRPSFFQKKDGQGIKTKKEKSLLGDCDLFLFERME
jgi:hypothetical protein